MLTRLFAAIVASALSSCAHADHAARWCTREPYSNLTPIDLARRCYRGAAECAAGQVCWGSDPTYGHCTATCERDSDCGAAGYASTCVDRRCLALCVSDADCPYDLSCTRGACAAITCASP